MLGSANVPNSHLNLCYFWPLHPDRHQVLFGVRALLQYAGESFPAWIGSQKGSPVGFQLLAPADMYTPKKLWEQCPAQGHEAEIPLHSLALTPVRVEALQTPSLQGEGDHTHLEQNPRVHS